MSSNLNKHALIGRLGADPEIKSFDNGDRVANLRIATSDTWKDKDTGERREKTEWHNVVIHGGLVGVVEQFAKKGTKVYLEGKVCTRKWQDKDGNDRYSTETVVRGAGTHFELLDGGNGAGGGNGNSSQSNSNSGESGGYSDGGPGDNFGADDFPF